MFAQSNRPHLLSAFCGCSTQCTPTPPRSPNSLEQHTVLLSCSSTQSPSPFVSHLPHKFSSLPQVSLAWCWHCCSWSTLSPALSGPPSICKPLLGRALHQFGISCCCILPLNSWNSNQAWLSCSAGLPVISSPSGPVAHSSSFLFFSL